ASVASNREARPLKAGPSKGRDRPTLADPKRGSIVVVLALVALVAVMSVIPSAVPLAILLPAVSALPGPLHDDDAFRGGRRVRIDAPYDASQQDKGCCDQRDPHRPSLLRARSARPARLRRRIV